MAVKECEIPRRKPLDESLGKNSIGLKKLISRGWLLGVYHNIFNYDEQIEDYLEIIIYII